MDYRDVFKQAAFAKTDGYRYVQCAYTGPSRQSVNDFIGHIAGVVSSTKIVENDRVEVGVDMSFALAVDRDLYNYMLEATKNMPCQVGEIVTFRPAGC